jgi:outer membrane protein
MRWFLVMSLFFASYAHSVTTLKEAFTEARLNMENLKRADAVIKQKEEREIRARATILPTLNGVGSYTKIDPPSAAGNNPFLLTRQYSAAIRLIQPLIRGGSLAAYGYAKEDILLAQFQKDATDINLYQLVISAYFSLMIARNDLKNLKELKKFTIERVKELEGRTKIGRSRKGELVQAEAQMLTADSQVKQGVINLQQAEKNFEFYTNMKAPDLAPVPDLPKSIPALDEYLRKIQTRPDLLAARQQVRLADKQIAIAKGGHYPNLDLIGNYYLARTGILDTSEWDVGLTLTLPIFQGGAVNAAVREAVDIKRTVELDSEQLSRTSERDLAINYYNYVQVHDQLSTLKEAFLKAEQAYKLNRRDYEYGQVTNLDVLVSLNQYIENKRSYENLSSLAHQAYKNLEASIGVLP